MLDENLIAGKFFIQHFQAYPTKLSCWIGLLLVYPTFHSYDIISNVRTSNFEWFNKTKTLCKIITMKKIIHIKSKWAWTATRKILTYITRTKWGRKRRCSRRSWRQRKETEKKKGLGNLSSLAFYLGVAFHYQSLQALIVSLAKACPSPSLIWHWMKWMDLHVGWTMLDDKHKRYKLSSNIPPTFIEHIG